MARTLRTKKGRDIYKKRQGQVEPVFGQSKQAGGFRQFAMRGISKMQAEWQLVCLTHNLHLTFPKILLDLAATSPEDLDLKDKIGQSVSDPMQRLKLFRQEKEKKQ